jgi:hypothetical protein
LPTCTRRGEMHAVRVRACTAAVVHCALRCRACCHASVAGATRLEDVAIENAERRRSRRIGAGDRERLACTRRSTHTHTYTCTCTRARTQTCAHAHSDPKHLFQQWASRSRCRRQRQSARCTRRQSRRKLQVL